VRVMPGDSVEVAFSTVYMRAGAVCARAGVRPMLPVDCEHIATGVPGRPARHRARRPVPCPNSRRVSAAQRAACLAQACALVRKSLATVGETARAGRLASRGEPGRAF